MSQNEREEGCDWLAPHADHVAILHYSILYPQCIHLFHSQPGPVPAHHRARPHRHPHQNLRFCGSDRKGLGSLAASRRSYTEAVATVLDDLGWEVCN